MISASASRVTRSSRSLRLAVLLLVGTLSVVTVLRAQEPAPVPAPATEARPAADAVPDAAPAQPAATPPSAAASTPASRAATPQRFEPTEKVRADFDVSFPIDI